MRLRTIAPTLCASAALVAAPATAIAQDSVSDAYGGQGEVAGSVSQPTGGGGGGSAPTGGGDVAPAAAQAPTAGAGASTAQQVSSSELPFTGFDATLVALGGLLLVGLGLGVRRLSRSSGGAVA